jgi:hypothetical protein
MLLRNPRCPLSPLAFLAPIEVIVEQSSPGIEARSPT